MTLYIGDNTQEAVNTGTIVGNYMWAYGPYSAAESGELTAAGVYITNAGGGDCLVGVYADNAGSPVGGAKIAAGSSTAIAGGWLSEALANQAVSSTSLYWLVFYPSVSCTMVHSVAGGSINVVWASRAYDGTMPSTFPAMSGSGSGYGAVSIYAAYTPSIQVLPSTLPNGDKSSAYSQTMSATNGTGPYTFAKTTGTLPTGLSLTTGGVLSGTPTATGTYNFTITATDSLSATGSQAYTVTINPALVILTTKLPNGIRGMPYSRTLSATGGSG
jgi:hypothetical protein